MQWMSFLSRCVNVVCGLLSGVAIHELIIVQTKSDVTASTLFIKEEVSALRDGASHSTMFATAEGKSSFLHLLAAETHIYD